MNRRTLLGGMVGAGMLSGCFAGDNPRTSDEDFACESGDAGEPINIDVLPGVDDPPHDIEDLDWEEDEDEWDNYYLGRCMDEEPSLAFEVIRRTGTVNEDARLPYDDPLYWVQFVTTEEEFSDLWDDPPDEIDAVEFDKSIVVLVQDGWGSNSSNHEWVRIEESDDGIHLYGYVHEPVVHDSDYALRRTAVIVDIGDIEVERVIVSQTRSRDRRIHYTSDDGVVDSSELE